MSYILEALKKAEKERRRAARTDMPLPFTGEVQKKKRSPLSMVLPIAVVFMSAALLVFWTKPWKPQGPSPSAHGDAQPQPAPKAVSAVARQDRGDSMNAPRETPADEPERPLNIPAAPPPLSANSASFRSPEQHVPPQKAPLLHELPPSVQGSIPEITISAHYYDSDPPSRVATVNGRVMHEGQAVSPGLTIERITPSGVVFGYQGYLFQKEVF
ncbi:MAG TPA: general secretion pathway protein GspB [Thermodesulfovibrionales bacterium]|nr:general secretion pathway protein GspB [Thermodesulfovibrionales bacterium]